MALLPGHASMTEPREVGANCREDGLQEGPDTNREASSEQARPCSNKSMPPGGAGGWTCTGARRSVAQQMFQRDKGRKKAG